MTRQRTVLGIDVDEALVARWSSWFAPDPQPFLILRGGPFAEVGSPLVGSLEMELRGTFEVYSLAEHTEWRFISAVEFATLSRPLRAQLVRSQFVLGRSRTESVRAWPSLLELGIRDQADGHRFVWWPSMLRGREEEVLIPYVEEGRRPSRHREVPELVWRNIAALLPGARRIGGTFPQRSGPNCFGAVMAAGGRSGADEVWMQRDPFEAWLESRTKAGGRDASPGTVLVWRSRDGLVQHAAVTLGEGWALHKPSEGWMSPTKVLTVAEVHSSARVRGRYLTRRTLHAAVASCGEPG